MPFISNRKVCDTAGSVSVTDKQTNTGIYKQADTSLQNALVYLHDSYEAIICSDQNSNPHEMVKCHNSSPLFYYRARGHRMAVIIMDMQWGEVNILSGLSCSPASTF